MQCLFCGKRVGILKGFSGTEFCSREHRERYRELTRLALTRLVDSSEAEGGGTASSAEQGVGDFVPSPAGFFTGVVPAASFTARPAHSWEPLVRPVSPRWGTTGQPPVPEAPPCASFLVPEVRAEDSPALSVPGETLAPVWFACGAAKLPEIAPPGPAAAVARAAGWLPVAPEARPRTFPAVTLEYGPIAAGTPALSLPAPAVQAPALSSAFAEAGPAPVPVDAADPEARRSPIRPLYVLEGFEPKICFSGVISQPLRTTGLPLVAPAPTANRLIERFAPETLAARLPQTDSKPRSAPVPEPWRLRAARPTVTPPRTFVAPGTTSLAAYVPTPPPRMRDSVARTVQTASPIFRPARPVAPGFSPVVLPAAVPPAARVLSESVPPVQDAPARRAEAAGPINPTVSFPVVSAALPVVLGFGPVFPLAAAAAAPVPVTREAPAAHLACVPVQFPAVSLRAAAILAEGAAAGEAVSPQASPAVGTELAGAASLAAPAVQFPAGTGESFIAARQKLPLETRLSDLAAHAVNAAYRLLGNPAETVAPPELAYPAGSEPVLPAGIAALTGLRPDPASTVLPMERAVTAASFREMPMPAPAPCLPEKSPLHIVETFEYLKPAQVEGESFSLWETIARFWRVTPAFVKVATAGAAAIFLLMTAVPSGGLTNAVEARLKVARQSIRERAAVELSEDFHSGMNDWEGGPNWAKSWTFDKAGYMRTGQLALYRPSMSMSDYGVEFLAQIERKSVGWVFRASDRENYYATKITVLKAGPLPSMALVRYPVIAGKEGPRVELPIRVMLHNNTPYRVQIRVQGRNFTTSIEGQLVDFWSDDRLKAGGVGFFSDTGERARLYWVKLAHQDDFLGRVCAWVSPNAAQALNRSLIQ